MNAIQFMSNFGIEPNRMLMSLCGKFRNIRFQCIIYNLFEMRPDKFNVIGLINLNKIIAGKEKIHAIPVSL